MSRYVSALRTVHKLITAKAALGQPAESVPGEVGERWAINCSGRLGQQLPKKCRRAPQ